MSILTILMVFESIDGNTLYFVRLADDIRDNFLEKEIDDTLDKNATTFYTKQ